MGWLERNASRRIDPQLVLDGARSVITLAASYGHSGRRRPDWARPWRHRPVRPIRGLSRRTCPGAWPTDRARPVARRRGARSLWYVDTGPILERDLGQRAGLGFIGKHTNLISRRLGNWFFISEILTTAVLEPDEPERNHCGKCTSCIDACPTGAITAPFQLDARRCISYLTIELKGPIPEEFRPAIGNRIYGCDDCLDACPWNRFAGEGRLMAPHRRDDLDQADLVELLALDDDGFRAKISRHTDAANQAPGRVAKRLCGAGQRRRRLGDPAARASRRRPRAADRRARPMGPWPSAAALRSELTALCPFFTGCNRTIEGYLLLP